MIQPTLSQSRFLVGMVLVVIAFLLLLVGEELYATAGAVAIGVLGLVTIAISRRN